MNLSARVIKSRRCFVGNFSDSDSKRVSTLHWMLWACSWVMVGTVVPAGSALAQLGQYSETTSTPVPGVGHAYISNLNETVNPENGALSIRISAPAPKERGLNLPVTVYSYDSNGQSVLVPNWAYNSSSNEEYVTNINFQSPVIQGVVLSPNSVSFDTNTINAVIGNRFPVSCTVWNNFIYTDASGNRHPLSGLRGTSNSQAEGCQGLGIYASAVGQQGGDGIYTGIFVGPGAQVLVYDQDGDSLAASAGTGGGNEDRNGNLQYASGRPYTFNSWQNTRLGGAYSSASVPGLGGLYVFSPSTSTRGATYPFRSTPP